MEKQAFHQSVYYKLGAFVYNFTVDKYFTRLTHVNSGVEATLTTPAFNIK